MTTGLLLLSLLPLLCNVVRASETHYSNEWVAHVPGGLQHVRSLALEHGYEVKRELIGFPDHYLLHRRDVPSRSRRSADHHTRKLESDSRVGWAEQQSIKVRSKRGYLEDRAQAEITANSFNDPDFKKEWYLYDSRKGNTKLPKEDLHVLPVWNKNITGKGIVVTVLDDGLEKNHTDLFPNYDPDASYDFNDEDPDPQPRYDEANTNRHGTRCAGEISMVANNGKCGVGVAYNSRIGGVKMLDGKVTDRLEGEALAFNHKHVDIYSASWGPNDDGQTMEAPGKLASAALERGISEGRGGKGVIYVWASGNGGRFGDNCNCDGYTGSIYTLSVSSASQHLELPWYGERCSSTVATTYSSGRYEDGKVSTTDLHDLCTDGHSGTSAAAPLAAGIVALVLETNPSLTWRDVQHLAVWTSEMAPLSHTEGWYRNARGLWVNSAFGFGLMNAAAMVELAKGWKTVPAQHKCLIKSGKDSNFPRTLRSGQQVKVDVYTSGCRGQANEINFIEHIVVKISVKYPFRGALNVFVVSPSGTKTVLLEKRDKDSSKDGYKDWPLMSVHNWGESPQGSWTLTFMDNTDKDYVGEIESVEMEIFGTKEEPAHMKAGPRVYVDYNRVENERKIYNDLKKEVIAEAQREAARRLLQDQLRDDMLAPAWD